LVPIIINNSQTNNFFVENEPQRLRSADLKPAAAMGTVVRAERVQ
jgi:hypothetical protein